MQKKKIQVFVSSTYADMHDERQAAVEAILTAGHIPAGMELFAAGDQSQMQVIRRWIDESDVFLLMLGGRYGSVEPTSGKSYIQLEYEYAIERGKPLFAVVIDPEALELKVKSMGTPAMEKDLPQQMKAFTVLVQSKIVRFWRDTRDIKLAVLETLSEYSRREDLVGWVRGNEAVSAASLAEEVARLARENAELRARATTSPLAATYNGLIFDDLYALLRRLPVPGKLRRFLSDELVAIATCFDDSEPGLVHAFWMLGSSLARQELFTLGVYEIEVASKLCEYGMTQYLGGNNYGLSDAGQQFLLRLEVERDTGPVQEYRR